MRNQLSYRIAPAPVEPLERRTLLSTTGLAATVITPPANITVPGSAGTSIVVQYTDPAGISLATITGSNLTVGVGSFAPSNPPVPVTVAGISASTDSTSATVTYDLGAPQGGYYSQNDDVYRVELSGNSVFDDAGVAAADNPLLGQYQVQIDPIDPSFPAGFATHAAIAQPDGKLVLVGAQDPSAPQAVLERLDATGTLDPSFANAGGVATTSGSNDAFNAVGIQSNGNIVVAGSADGDLLLAQYSPAGISIDQTATPIDLGSGITATLNGLAVAPDNSIYAVGSESNGSAVVVHYLADGLLDTSFGPPSSSGIATFAVGSAGTTSLSSVAFADNTLIVAGSAASNVFVAEFTPTGSFAPAFNSGAPEIVAGLSTDAENVSSPALAVAADGDIYVAARASTGDLAVAHLTPAGQADSTFGGDGIATTHFGPAGVPEIDDAESILLRSDGTIVVAGTSNSQSAITVYNADGTPFSQFPKDAFAPTSDPTVTTDAAVATLSANGAVVFSTTANGTAISKFDIAAAPASPPPPATPPITSKPAPTVIGTIGKVNGRRISHLTFTASNGAFITLKLTGSGTAEALQSGNDIDLIITGRNQRLSASSSGAFMLGRVTVTGALANFSAPAASLAGTISANGKLGTIRLGAIAGTIAAAGNIAAIDADSLTGATIFAGANLGSDGLISGGDATFAAASIDSVRISGAIADSTIAAGVDPNDGQFFAGAIARLTAATADSASRFEASRFGVVKLPDKIDPANDARFQT